MCVRKFGVKGKFKVIERPAFLRTLLTEIHDFLQDAFQHIILCLCIREGIVDLKQLFDLWDNRPFALLLLTEGGQLTGESFHPVLRLGDTSCEVTGAVEESVGVVHALLQQIVSTGELLSKRLNIVFSLFERLFSSPYLYSPGRFRLAVPFQAVLGESIRKPLQYPFFYERELSPDIIAITVCAAEQRVNRRGAAD